MLAHSKPVPPWLFGRSLDLALIVGTPLFILPLSLLLIANQSPTAFGAVVGVLATGHLCPTLLRIYGDKALVRRFPWRFVFLPPFLFGAYLGAHYAGSYSLKYLVIIWGHWHGMMQTYGVARIYDAKHNGVRLGGGRLDWVLCLLWFAGGTLFSEERTRETVEGLYRLALPAVSPALLPSLQLAWGTTTTLVTVLFLWRWFRAPNRHSPVKLAHYLVSFSFWWLCMVGTPDPILGIGMWEIFHDLQYIAVTWVFARNYNARAAPGSWLWGRLFRIPMVAAILYGGAVVAFGSIKRLTAWWPTTTTAVVVGHFIMTCNVLHFYYDGFIWKLRDQETMSGLGLKQSAPSWSRSLFRTGLSGRHLSLWALVLGAALVAGLYQLSQGTPSDHEVARRLVSSLPTNTIAHHQLTDSLVRISAWSDAHQALERWEAIAPDNAEAEQIHIRVATKLDDLPTLVTHLQRYIALRPDDFGATIDLGINLVKLGRWSEAIAAFSTARAVDPANAAAPYHLGRLYGLLGQHREAAEALAEATTLAPTWGEAQVNYSLAKAARDRP